MNVIVTGGAGGLGKAVCTHLLARGAHVTSIDRRCSPELPAAVKQRVVDLMSLSEVVEAIEHADALVHCANLPWFRHDHAYEAAGLINNTAATYHVLVACEQRRIARVVNASSIHAYGCIGPKSPRPTEHSAPLYLPLDEDHPCLPVRPYSLSKRNGETACDSFAVRFPWMRIVSLRLSALVDKGHPHPWVNSKPNAIFQHAVGETLRSYTPVELALQSIALAADRAAEGHCVLNCVSRRASQSWNEQDIEAYYGIRVPFRQRVPQDESLIRPEQLERTLDLDCNVV